MNDAWNPPENSSRQSWDGYGGDGGPGLSARQVFEPTTLFRLGWAVLKEQPAIVLIGGVCLFAVQVLPSLFAMPLELATEAWFAAAGEESNPIEGLWSGIMSLLSMPFNFLVMAGMYTAVARWVRDEEADLSTLFTSFGPAWRMLLASMTVFFLVVPLALVAIVPLVVSIAMTEWVGPFAGLLVVTVGLALLAGFLWVQLGLSLVGVSAALDGVGPIESIKASWRAAHGARIVLFASYFGAALAAVLACCLAVVPLIPLFGGLNAAFATAWLLHTQPASQTSSWRFVRRNDLGALYD